MPAAELPDYATRVYHNVAVTTSLPLLALFSPTRELYRVEAARKCEPSVERRSLERKGGILRNVLDCVTKAVGYPIVSLVFGALSVAVYSASVSVVAKMVTTKDELPAIKDAVPPREETPPPSRPPSPPPVSDPSDTESESAWSILIEELQDEPKSPIERQRGRTSQRSGRARSASWSRSFMSSFRRKKSKSSRSEERHRPDADELAKATKNADQEATVEKTSAPKKSSSQVELSQVKPKPSRVLSLSSFRRRKSGSQLVDSPAGKSVDQVDASVPAASEVATASAQQDPGAIETAVAKVEDAQPVKEKIPRMLSLGSFRRRKPADSPKPEALNKEEEVVEVTENLVCESVEVKETEAKPKSRMLSFTSFGRRKPLPDRSISLDQPLSEDSKLKVKAKKEKSNKTGTLTEPKNPEEVDTSKSKPKKKSKSKPEEGTAKSSKSKLGGNTLEAEIAEAPEPIPEIEPVVKRKDNAFVSFFKREKKTVPEVAEEPATELAPLKKASKLRSSFARRAKTKSVDADSQPASTKASTAKIPRSSSLFGSTFSLRRVFHPVDSEPQSQQPRKSQSGILTKRGGHSSGSRPKSVQLDESPQFMDKEAEGAKDSSKQTFGFKLKPKKPSRGKSVEQSKPTETIERRASSEDETMEAGQVPLEADGTATDATTENKEPAVVTGAIPSDPVPEPSTEQTPANPKINGISLSS